MTLAFTGRADLLTAYAAWRTEWHKAWLRYDAAGMERASLMMQRMARGMVE